MQRNFFYALALSLAFCSQAFAKEASPAAQAPLPQIFQLLSPAFKDGAWIPDKNTCQGKDVNPPLLLKNVPPGTKSLALTVFDPRGSVGPWVHWVVFNINLDVKKIKEDETPGIQALNDFGNFYYNGPCPADQSVHRYVFTVYALNSVLSNVNEGATKDTLEKAMAGKTIGQAELIGIYQKNHWE